MALASASPRASAQILHFPGAVTAPVVNPPKRRLHYDTTLRPIKLGISIRNARLWHERETEQQADKARRDYFFMLGYMAADRAFKRADDNV